MTLSDGVVKPVDVASGVPPVLAPYQRMLSPFVPGTALKETAPEPQIEPGVVELGAETAAAINIFTVDLELSQPEVELKLAA